MVDHLNLTPDHHERQAALHLQAIDRATDQVALRYREPEVREEYALRVQMAHAHAALALSRRIAATQGTVADRIRVEASHG